MKPEQYLADTLSVPPEALAALDREMAARIGRADVLQRVADAAQANAEQTLGALTVARDAPAAEVRRALCDAALEHDRRLRKYLETVEGADEFQKAATLARSIARVGKGFFLKKSFGAEILAQSKPEHLLAFLGAKDVDELLAKHDVTEIFSALRFIETDEWMHGTFEKAYSKFTAADFEERDIEVRVLGTEWLPVAKQYIEKKHHNLSHLKEFGVIFINPMAEGDPGKFLRDFALIFHYFHEVEFYSKLFRANAAREDFAARLKSFLRGDVPERRETGPGEWLIVQRYLGKLDPEEPRLYLPHVNPESVHWFRGERDLARFGEEHPALGLALWRDLDWVGLPTGERNGQTSFDLEDNAMTAVYAAAGEPSYQNYHQHEALWTKLFMEYAGGEAGMEELLIRDLITGVVQF
jgi:hypothetical protein